MLAQLLQNYEYLGGSGLLSVWDDDGGDIVEDTQLRKP
jgi:hypothetical protein